MSSEVEFFDILYLGIFAILSPAFDRRYHRGQMPPPTLVAERSYALGHFHSLLNIFSLRFIILLGGEPVAISYVVDRMLAEFAAAAMVFAYAVGERHEDLRISEGEVPMTAPMFAKQIEEILHDSYPKVLTYYSRCFKRGHSHFLWTGPDPQILPRSEDLETIISLSTNGEMLDNPAEPIYLVELDSSPPPSIVAVSHLGKRPVSGRNGKGSADGDGEAKKKKLPS